MPHVSVFDTTMVDPSEDAVSVDAALAMRATFALDSRNVGAFFLFTGDRQFIALDVRIFTVEWRLTEVAAGGSGSISDGRPNHLR